MHTDLDTQITHDGNASTVTTYPVNFPLADASHLVAISRVTSTGVETTLTGGQFAFTPVTDGNGRITGGSVTTNPAIPATSTLLLKRVTPRTQLLNLTSGGAFGAEAFESALDKLVMIMQEIVRDYGAADAALDARVTALEP
jgi:hypothetical protein